MKNQVAALTFSLTLVRLVSGQAHAAPTDVENIDEPARVAHQQLVQLPTNGSEFLFSKVPANHRLRITNVNCQFEMLSVNGLSAVYLLNDNDAPNSMVLALPSVQQSDPYYVVVNAEVSLFVAAGQQPSMRFTTYMGGVVSTAFCSISGYQITL